LYLDVSSINSNERCELTYTIDLSDVSTLEITDKNPNTNTDGNIDNVYGISVNGSDLYSIELGTSSFTTRTFDISSYSGECTVGFYIENQTGSYYNRDLSAVWSELNLV